MTVNPAPNTSNDPNNPTAADLRQQRCGHDGYIAWRLSRPGSGGNEWQPCWSCKTALPPQGERHP